MNRLNIGWVKHRIDTLALPGLLGHTAKRCSENQLPSAIKNKLSATSAPIESEDL